MPVTLSDIEVPVNSRSREDGGIVHTCTLCDLPVGYDYHVRPEPHKLDECLRELKETVAALKRDGERPKS